MLATLSLRTIAVLAPLLAVPFALSANSPESPQDKAAPGMVRVEVTDGKGGPISNAEVFYLLAEEAKEWQLEQHGIADLDWATKVSVLGRTARTNLEGRLELPRWEGGMLMLAHRDQRWYGRHFESGPGPMELPLRNRTGVQVRLTAKGGLPLVGGTVALRASDGVDDEYDLAHAPLSALDNLAHFFEIKDFQEEEAKAGYTITIAQVGTFRRIPRVEIDLLNPPTSPVLLEGLPTASIELEIVGTDGKPVRGEIEVTVSAVRPPGELIIEPPPVRRVTENGRVVLPDIGLGLDLLVEVQRPYSRNSNKFELKGPMEPDKPLVKKLDFVEKDVLLVAIVKGPDGQPMVDEYVDIYFRTGNFLTKGKGEQTVRTRSDGRIQYPLPCRGRDAIQNADVKFVRQVEAMNLHLEYAWATTEVTQAGIVDLGEITLR